MTSPGSATIAQSEFTRFLAEHPDFHTMYLTSNTVHMLVNNVRDTMRAVELSTQGGLRILSDQQVHALCRAVYGGVYNEWVMSEGKRVRAAEVAERIRIRKYDEHEGEM